MNKPDKLPPELVCPHCGHRAPLAEFIPPKMRETFERWAGVLLVVIVTLALLKGCGLM